MNQTSKPVLLCTSSWVIGLLLLGCRDSARSNTNQDGLAGTAASIQAAASANATAVLAITRVDPPAKDGSEAPNLFSSAAGPLLTWVEKEQERRSVRFSRFAKGSWTPATTVVESSDLIVNWADVPAVAESAGRIWVAFGEGRKKAEGYRVELALSTNGGQTFTRQGPLHSDVSDTEHGFVAFAPERDNSLRAFWLDQRALTNTPPAPSAPAPAMHLYTAVLADKVTNEVLLDERTCDCCNLGAAGTEQGTVVAYRDRLDDEVRDISVIHSLGKGFSIPHTAYDDGYRIAGCPVNGPALDTEVNRVAIAWYTYAGEQARVKIAFSSDSGVRFSAPITVAESQNALTPLGRVMAIWGDQGDAIVGYMESDREKARIVVRRVHSDGAVFAPLVITETRPERKSGFPKMVRVNNHVLVVWTEAEASPRVRAQLVPLAALARTAQVAAPNASAEQRGLQQGDSVPAFEVRTLEGKPISLSSLAGKPVLVNLWASYCEPCRQEMPVLSALYAQYKKRGLEVVGIAQDERMATDALKALIQKKGIQYSIWHDPGDRAGRALGVRVLPATFLIDRKGIITLVRRGAVHENDEELKKRIEAIL